MSRETPKQLRELSISVKKISYAQNVWRSLFEAMLRCKNQQVNAVSR